MVDATDEGALLALGEGAYDAAVCTMALMDMVEIEPLLRALVRLLRPGARFVFSVMHPCFNNPAGDRHLAEERDCDGELVTRYSIAIEHYIRPSVARGLGMIGQPQPHYYFHRPLSLLLGGCFAVGMVLDGLEEPTFPESSAPRRTFSWENYREIPPVLIARLRTPA